MGWTIVCESPYELEHEDGSIATGQSAQIVTDNILENYEDMLAEREEENKAKAKLESVKGIDIKKINGREIIAFLNKQSDDNDEWADISISSGSFKFEEQNLSKDRYTLIFTGSFNNWGEEQEISGNQIRISSKGIEAFLCEPFEGDGTDEVIEEALTKWLKTHKFDANPEKKFYKILEKAFEDLGKVKFADKEELQEVIDQLIEAKTYMK